MNADPAKRDHFVFGAGRRLCQGMHIAERSLYLAMTRTLWAFDVKRAVHKKTGQEIIPDVNNLDDGLFLCPSPFAANIAPKSENRARAVREEWGRVASLLDDKMQWGSMPEGLKWRDYEGLEED